MSEIETPFIEPWIDTTHWSLDAIQAPESPCYVISEERLEHNMKILQEVQQRTSCKILMALKSFSMFSVFPLLQPYLAGAEASSVNEARLGATEFGKETHTFSPSFTEKNIHQYIEYSDHLVFNSFSQWERFKHLIKASDKKISCGIRVNPEHCETETPMYDPCGPESHFGVTLENFQGQNLDGIEGLHFHNLCELNADALERTLAVFEQKFGTYLKQMQWVNFGGGHHITRNDYNISLLCDILIKFKLKYPHLEVYLEPGEAIALNAGVLLASVVDLTRNGVNIAVLDVSATTHMPDVLEMPYLPTILDAKAAENTDQNVYKLVGPTCLTGDVIGKYAFSKPLEIGQKMLFMNMAIYTMVKNTTFNGVNLPSIAILKKDGSIQKVKDFGYEDFKNRLS